MKKVFHVFGASVLALAMSGLPTVALADNNNVEGDVLTQVRVQTQEVNISASGTARMRESGDGQVQPDLEDDSSVAASSDDLKQKIEVRKNQLEQEVASTTEADKNIVENANPVRLAAHALLASKNLIGGIGPEVSEIAKEMNDSVATTTNAEAKIQSRGFITRFLFGGDSVSAEAIAQVVARNQAHIQKLTGLLNQVTVSADIKATLTAQITALEGAEARLQALAEKEQKQWGLFSWRF